MFRIVDRARDQGLGHVLEACRTGVRGLGCGHLLRQVHRDRQAPAARLSQGREERRARQRGVHLDAIHSERGQRVHHEHRARRIEHGDTVWRPGVGAVQDRPGTHDQRPDSLAGGDLAAPGIEDGQLAA